MSGCAVVVADFAWFSQTCGETSVGTVIDEFGIARHVCAEHWECAADTT